MSPLAIAYLSTAAICVVVGLQQLVIALRVEGRKNQLWFAFAAIAVAGDAILEWRNYSAVAAEAFLALMPWTALFIGAAIVSMSIFIGLHTGTARRWLLGALVALSVFTVILDFAVGIAYVGPVELHRQVLPWGEEISLVSGATNPLRIIADLVLFTFVVILLDTTLQLMRRGDRHTAWLMGGSLAVYSLGLVTIIPVDLGILPMPSLHTFSFLVIVAAMSWELSDELIRASQLSREVVSSERRWRQLIDNVQLLVVGLDRSGKIVSMNPYAEAVSGYSAAERIGRPYLEFVPEQLRGEIEASVDQGLDGDPQSENERPLITRDGEERSIRWRSVTLRGPSGEVEGLLSVGADVTERRASEAELRRTTAELGRTVAELEELKLRLEEENILLKEEIQSVHGFADIVGESDALTYVLHKVEQVAPTDATVLIQGETGVGKELVARAVHSASERSGGPFIAVNCSALSPSLIESELFGHERGAFTGADRRRLGRFELARGGTLLLDEVGDLPLEFQPKLLRVLQEGEFERVGGSETLHTDARIISASNRNLSVDVEAGRIRADLYYRLAVYPITVPPLRERADDIPLLVRHFLGQMAAAGRARVDEVPPAVMQRLQEYHWPGNVRELQNAIERAALQCTDGVLRLAEPLSSPENPVVAVNLQASANALPTLEELERDYIGQVLRECGGQIAGRGGAAQLLGLHPNTLRSRMKKLGIRT